METQELILPFACSGKYEILDGYGHDGNILFKAATTCYRSEETTNKTPDDFIKMLKNMKHLSMIEFMWVTIVLRDYNRVLDNVLFSREKFLTSNVMADHNTVVSGNARAWLDFMENYKTFLEVFKGKEKNLYEVAYNTIAELLHAVNPTMFGNDFKRLKTPLEASLVQSIEQEDKDLYTQHHWVAVKFTNVSRALIDEFVRHRMMSYAVSSTRYIDNSNFRYVKPVMEDVGAFRILHETMGIIQANYKKLLEMDVKKDHARQILPLGIAQDMVVAGTIENWKHVFEVRSRSNVHWEIREILRKLKQEDVFK